LAHPGYAPEVIAIGTNTDPYQPIERERRIMRSLLEVLERTSHPVGIVTKSALVVRDIDILERMAKRGLARVALSVTTLDRRIARAMEPRAATPAKRLEAIRRLSEAGIPTSAMVAPIIPGLTDSEIEGILEAVHAAGATGRLCALRLPLEIKVLFRDGSPSSPTAPTASSTSCNRCMAAAITHLSSVCASAARGPMRSRSACASGSPPSASASTRIASRCAPISSGVPCSASNKCRFSNGFLPRPTCRL
jgi:hypothetical protein